MKVTENTMLKIIKTKLKPSIKLMVLITGFGLFPAADDSAEPGELPIMHNQDGISGNTQGEKKDTNPAPNAIITDKFSLILCKISDFINNVKMSRSGIQKC